MSPAHAALTNAGLRRHRAVARRCAALAAEDIRWYTRYLILTPVLWLGGVLTLAGLALTVRLAWRRWPQGGVVAVIALAWISIGLFQALASLANGMLAGDMALGVRNALGMPVIGWLSAGLAIAAGYGCRLADPRVARATAVLGGWILLFGAIAAVARLAGLPWLILETPVSLALPELDVARFYGTAQFFLMEDTLGEVVTRLILFFPWATGLGLGGAAIVLVSLRVRDVGWRLVGAAGGLVGVVFSWSRAALIAVVAALAVQAFLKLPALGRAALTGLAMIALFGAMAGGFDPVETVIGAQQSVSDARAGSSLARELIYEKSWEGFLESPIIGQGWIGPSVHHIHNLPIGSHSTVYGLLYTGGLPTFLAFAAALLLTTLTVAVRLVSARTPRKARADLRTALGLCVLLAVFSPFESLFSLTLPCLFLFTWIGGALREASP
ncbi:O-antigen ligase family protein [Azospirillum sp.]|uniref:O-antigen ligase family protein n=1 Tax=Azospirillum sp. TaxID=34012 RepID=UPI003D733458